MVRALSIPSLQQGAARIMTPTRLMSLAAVTLTACLASPAVVSARDDDAREQSERKPSRRLNVQVGPRPYHLVEDMDESALKRKLQQCSEGPFYKTEFSIGHRGAPLQFPEHTKESYEAAARMGAGILECDVTFTKDRQLVCRHSQCDLHTTTNILATPALAAKCTQPFQPANPTTGRPASALCCTSDITLAEFKQLCGKMDASNPAATSSSLRSDVSLRRATTAIDSPFSSHRAMSDAASAYA